MVFDPEDQDLSLLQCQQLIIDSLLILFIFILVINYAGFIKYRKSVPTIEVFPRKKIYESPPFVPSPPYNKIILVPFMRISFTLVITVMDTF